MPSPSAVLAEASLRLRFDREGLPEVRGGILLASLASGFVSRGAAST